jgi:hypothetical protein
MPFKVAELVALVVFVLLTIVSYRRFHPKVD